MLMTESFLYYISADRAVLGSCFRCFLAGSMERCVNSLAANRAFVPMINLGGFPIAAACMTCCRNNELFGICYLFCCRYVIEKFAAAGAFIMRRAARLFAGGINLLYENSLMSYRSCIAADVAICIAVVIINVICLICSRLTSGTFVPMACCVA